MATPATSSRTASPTTSSAISAPSGALHYRRGPMTTVVMYDEVALSRWIEEAVRERRHHGGARRGAARASRSEGRRIRHLDCATRYGDVRISATGFVDASGDAALAWLAGLPCREPADGKIYGTQMIVLEHINEDKYPAREEITARLFEKGRDYGMGRRDGFAFHVSRPRHRAGEHEPRRDAARSAGRQHFRARRQGAGGQGGRIPALRVSRSTSAAPACAPTAFPASARRAGSPGVISSPRTRSATARDSTTPSPAPPGRSNCTMRPKASSGSRSASTTCTTCRCAA